MYYVKTVASQFPAYSLNLLNFNMQLTTYLPDVTCVGRHKENIYSIFTYG